MTRSRSRTTKGPTYGTAYVRYRYPSGTTWYYLYNNSVLLEHHTESMTDVVTSDFSSKRSKGEVVINPVSHVKSTIETIGSGAYHWTRTNGSVYEETGPGLTRMQLQRFPQYMQSVPVDPAPKHDMLAACKLQALGNIDRSPYSFAEDIAELHETLRFLRNPLASIKQLSKSFEEGVNRLNKLKRYANRADAIADVWLQYRFAFSPLLRSVNDAVKSVITEDKPRANRRIATGKDTFSDRVTNHGTIVTWESRASVEVTTECHAGIIYEVSNPTQGWRDKYGLRFKDIPETMWAILPYSFMVDRVFNLSQAVRGLTAFLDPNVKMLNGWESTKTTKVVEREWIRHVSKLVQSVQSDATDVLAETTSTYTREAWTPTINDLMPEVRIGDLVDTSTEIADLLALVWARLR